MNSSNAVPVVGSEVTSGEMRPALPVEVVIKDHEFIKEFGLPTIATPGSAAVDLRANVKALAGGSEVFYLQPGNTILLRTGIAIAIKNPEFAAFMIPRSGLGHRHGIVLGNGTGLIDSDYQGEMHISLTNQSTTSFKINHGDRIAQLYFAPVIRPFFTIVDDFGETTQRGEGGFNSTGTK